MPTTSNTGATPCWRARPRSAPSRRYPPDTLRTLAGAGIGTGRRHAFRLPVRPPAAHLLDRIPSCGCRRTGTLDIVVLRSPGSEARLASFIAIAKGDVPQHHWFHLGRLVTNVDGRATLMSWGGTMFEYLMPQLLMRSFPGHAARSELSRQRPAADRVRTPARRPVGHFGVGVCVHRPGRHLSVPGVRRPRPRPQARAGHRPRHRAVRDGAREPRDACGSRPRTSPAWPPRVSTADTGSTKRSTTTRAAATSTRPPPSTPSPVVVRAYFAHHQGCRSSRSRTSICNDIFVVEVPRRSARPGDRAAPAGARAA